MANQHNDIFSSFDICYSTNFKNVELEKTITECKEGNKLIITNKDEINKDNETRQMYIYATSISLDALAGLICDINKPLRIKYPSSLNTYASLICIYNGNDISKIFNKD